MFLDALVHAIVNPLLELQDEPFHIKVGDKELKLKTSIYLSEAMEEIAKTFPELFTDMGHGRSLTPTGDCKMSQSFSDIFSVPCDVDSGEDVRLGLIELEYGIYGLVVEDKVEVTLVISPTTCWTTSAAHAPFSVVPSIQKIASLKEKGKVWVQLLARAGKWGEKS